MNDIFKIIRYFFVQITWETHNMFVRIKMYFLKNSATEIVFDPLLIGFEVSKNSSLLSSFQLSK